MDIVFTSDTYLQRLIPVGYNILLFFLKIFMESSFFSLNKLLLSASRELVEQLVKNTGFWLAHQI